MTISQEYEMSKNERHLRNVLNIALALNLDSSMSGEPCIKMFDACEAMACLMLRSQVDFAISKCSDPDTAMEVLANRFGWDKEE